MGGRVVVYTTTTRKTCSMKIKTFETVQSKSERTKGLAPTEVSPKEEKFCEPDCFEHRSLFVLWRKEKLGKRKSGLFK